MPGVMKDVLQRFVSCLRQERARISVQKSNPSIHLGRRCRFQNPEYIHFGHNIVLGDDTKLLCTNGYNGNVLAKEPSLVIGDRFHCTRNLTIQCAGNVTIGKDVLFASDIFIIDYNHGLSPETSSYLENALEAPKGVTVDSGSWIGNNVIILGGVTIGKKSVIGAGSVVVRSIPDYCVAVGNPAKVIKKYDKTLGVWKRIRSKERECND